MEPKWIVLEWLFLLELIRAQLPLVRDCALEKYILIILFGIYEPQMH